MHDLLDDTEVQFGEAIRLKNPLSTPSSIHVRHVCALMRPSVMLNTSRTQIIKKRRLDPKQPKHTLLHQVQHARGPGTDAAPLLAEVIAALSPSEHLRVFAQNSEVLRSTTALDSPCQPCTST